MIVGQKGRSNKERTWEQKRAHWGQSDSCSQPGPIHLCQITPCLVRDVRSSLERGTLLQLHSKLFWTRWKWNQNDKNHWSRSKDWKPGYLENIIRLWLGRERRGGREEWERERQRERDREKQRQTRPQLSLRAHLQWTDFSTVGTTSESCQCFQVEP